VGRLVYDIVIHVLFMGGSALVLLSGPWAERIEQSERVWLKRLFFNHPRKGILIIGNILFFIGLALAISEIPSTTYYRM